jgi:type II secretion system protein G
MRSASLAGAVAAAVVDRQAAVGEFVAGSGEIASLDGPDDLIETIPRLALMLCSATAAELMEVEADGTLKLLSRSGVADETPRQRIQFSLRQSGRNLVLIVWAAPGATLTERDLEQLTAYCSLAGTSLARARSNATASEAAIREDAARESAARDAATMAALRDGVLVLDREGVVRSINHAAAGVLGVKREHALGRRLSDIPGLAPLGLALVAGDATHLTEVVSVPHGELVIRAEACERTVATLRGLSSAKQIGREPVPSGARFTFGDLVGGDPAFLAAREIARRVSQSDVPILITGESGTGKEMFAQAIHNSTPGIAPSFVGVNVAAIPRELLESELFGYEGGAFTGARSSGHAGKFEVAGRGTLLLDEIGDMPMEMQARLLRVLQEKVVQRLGSTRNIPLHARVIATSHRDLEEAIAVGTFRLDLFHRLRGVHLRLPPLRQRRGDVPLLVEHYLRKYAHRMRRTAIDVTPAVMADLKAHEWPGNVRELANLIEGEASLLPPDQNLIQRMSTSIEPARRPGGSTSTWAQTSSPGEILPLEAVERRACEQALQRYGGNVARAASALGVSKGTLYNKIKRYHIVLSNRARLASGFTLLEMLVVMVLIGLLAGFVAPRYFAQVGKSQVKVARAQIDAFDKALDQFRIDVGHYPTNEEGLQALVVPPSGEPTWAGPYLKKEVPKDPWSRPYLYQQPGTHGGDFDLLSYGKDGRAGGTGEDADITNW